MKRRNNIFTSRITTFLMLVTMLVLSNNTATAKIIDSWIAGRDVTAEELTTTVTEGTDGKKQYSSTGTLQTGGTDNGINSSLSLTISNGGGAYHLHEGEGKPFVFNGTTYTTFIQGSDNPTFSSNVITGGAYYAFTAPCTGKAVIYIHYTGRKNMYVSEDGAAIGYTVDGKNYDSGNTPAENTVSAAKLEFPITSGKDYVFGVKNSKLMLMGVIVMDDDPMTATAVDDMTLNSYEIKKQGKISLSLTGVEAGDYTITAPTGFSFEGGNTLTVNGEANKDVTFTYASDVAVPNSTGEIYIMNAAGTKGTMVPVNYGKTAQRNITEMPVISEQTTWDWSKAGTVNVQLIDPAKATIVWTNPTKHDDETYSILGDIAEITKDETFKSEALNIAGEYLNRTADHSAQASYIKFNVAKAGTIKVKFASTGNSTRYLLINGEAKGYSSNASNNYITTDEIDVNAGDVILSGKKGDGTQDIGAYLRYYSITYTPEPDAVPSIVTDLDEKYYGFVDAQVQLDAVFSGATSYKWYLCDDALGTNPVEIPGATTATCVYTPTAAGNVYIKCVAHNKKGDTDSRVTTVSARVNNDEAFGISTPITADNKMDESIISPDIPAEAHVTISSPVSNNKGHNYFNYKTANGRTLYQGTSPTVTVTNAMKNTFDYDGEKNVTAQTGENIGAETLGTYVGFNVTVDNGYKMSLSGISLDMYADNATHGYEFIIEDAVGNQLYKSPTPYSITSATTSTANLINFVPFTSADLSRLSNLKGTFKVKLVWWCTSSGKYIAVKNFSVKGVVEELTEDPESPVITTNVPAVVNNSEPAKELNVTIVGEHYKTIQWYKNTTNSTVGAVAIDGQTSTTLTYAPTAGEKNSTLYFYAVLNNPDAEGEKNATTNIVTVNVGARKDCNLKALKLTNGFNAFVEMTGGIVEAYYMDGESAPSVESYEVSGGATFSMVGNTITVTAEDGTTTKTYEYRCTAVHPLSDAGQQTMSNEAPEWLKGGHWHNSEPYVYEAWKHTEQHIGTGYNRTYFFVGPCELLRIDVGSSSRFAKGGKGIVTTYIDGVKTESEVTLPAAGEFINIPCSMEHNTMIEIVNLSESGEWGFLNVQQDRKLHVTYTKGEGEIEGYTPDNLEMPSIGAHVTIPTTNYSLFKPGYTMTGWTDGTNSYEFKTDYLLTEDITLRPVWKKNGMEAEDVNGQEVTWTFGRKGHMDEIPAMSFESSEVKYYVVQPLLDGVATDMAMKIQNGSFQNNTSDNATVKDGTEFTVKAVAGATIRMRAAYNFTSGEDLSYYSADVWAHGVQIGTISNEQGNIIKNDQSHFILTYTLPEDFKAGDVTFKIKYTCIAGKEGNAKMYYLSVTYPSKTASNLAIVNGRNNIKLDYRDDEKKKYQLTRNTDYTTSSEGAFEYLSSDENIATVSAEGLITAIAGGNVTISVVQKATAERAGGRIDFSVNVPFPADLRFYNGTTLVHTSYTDTGEPIGNGKFPADPTETGKNFVGWFTLANGAGVKATPYTIINEPMDFYALFMDVPQLVDGFYQLGLEGNENPGQRGDKLVNAITWAARQAPDDEAHRIKIWIPNGTYDLRELTCTEVGSYISLIGESQNGVVIQNMPEREGLDNTATLKVTGSQVVMQNLTLKNVIEEEAETTDPETGVTYQRGVCLEDCGTGNVYREVRLLGRQNTYYASGASVTSYFENSELHGATDMVGGNGNVWFEQCQLKIEQNAAAYIAAPETTGAAGFVFNGCTISNADGASMTGKYYLGHGLKQNAKAAFHNTTKTIAYKESGWGRSETGFTNTESTESATIDPEVFTSVGNATKLLEPTGVTVGSNNVTWDAVANAGGYVLYNGGERIRFLTTNSYALPQGAPTTGYTVATISQTGIIGDAATETTAPTITKDLVASQECYVGKPLNLAITATGGSITYQWYKSPTRGSYVIVADPANAIPDATSATYNYNASAEGDAWFCCKATNSQGSTYSAVTMVTAKNPVITQDLRSMYNVKTGDTKELAIIVEGGNTYQWYTCTSATNTEEGKTAIPSATSALLQYTPAKDGTTYIYCKVNGCVNSVITTLIASQNAVSADKTYHAGTFVKELYDFKSFTASTSSSVPTLTINTSSHQQTGTNAHTVYEINNPTGISGTLDLNGRFAVDYHQNAAYQMRWMWRTSGNAYQCGMAGNWNSKGTAVTSYNMSVLDLYPGDKVTIVYAMQAGKTAELHVCDDAQAVGVSAGGIISSGVTYTIAGTAGSDTKKQLDLYSTNNNLGIHSIQIESNWYATAEPSISIQPAATCKTYVGVPRPLTVEASNTNTYQWYVNDTDSKNGATAIEGATQSVLYYTPTEAGEKYVFCVLGNENGYKSTEFSHVTVSDEETVTLDFVNRSADDKTLVLGSVNGTKDNVDLYNVVTPYDYVGYLATGGDYVMDNGLTNNSGGGDRPARVLGLAEGDIVTIQGSGFTSIAGHELIVTSGNATIEHLSDNFVTIKMNSAGDLTFRIWRQKLVHIHSIIVKKKAGSNITTNLNEKYFVKTNDSQRLTIASDGDGDTYQWYSNTTKSNKGGVAIPDETTASYVVPTTENGTTYYYCLVKNTSGTVTPSNVAQVDVADVIFRDFELDVRQKRDYGLTTDEVANNSTVSFGVIVEENGTLTRVETTDPEYQNANVKVSGKYTNPTLGLQNAQFIVPVQGKVKFSVGRTDNADATLYGDVIVKDASDKVVTTLSTKGGKWSSNKKNVDYGYYSGTATTLTFTTDKYVPYFRIEAVEVSASEPPTLTQGTYSVAEHMWEYTMTTNADGATIYYTTDGTAPTTASSSVANGGKVLIPADATIKAYAVCDEWYDSEVSSAVAPAAPAAKGSATVTFANGETGDNVGTPYSVDAASNGGKPDVFDDGLKFNTTTINYENNGETTSGTSFRINVNPGYRVTGVNVKGLTVVPMTRDVPTQITVNGIYADLADIATAKNYLTGAPVELPTSGEGVEFSSNALMSAEKYVDIMTTSEGAANLQVTLNYEYADAVTGITIDGNALTAEQVATFNAGALTISEQFAGNPEIVVTTQLGYNYALQKPAGDSHVYTFSMIGADKTITLSNVLKPLPVITINENNFRFGDRDGEGHVTNRGYAFTVEHEAAGTLMVSIDGADAVAYTTGMRAIESVEAYYTAGDLYPATHVTAHTSSTHYDKNKPFAAYVTKTSASELETADAKVILDGVRKVYNVVPVAAGNANPTENLDAADLVVLSETMGSGDNAFKYVNTTETVTLPNNILNFKLFAPGKGWAWHSGAASIADNPIEITPENANYSIFNGVSFNNNAANTITLWDNPDDVTHLQGLAQGSYTTKGQGLGFIPLATCTVGGTTTYDVLNYFENNSHTYVQFGLSIADLKHYNENVKTIVSNICEMINAGTALNTPAGALATPVITDNGNGTATIRTTVPLATIKYVALAIDAEKPTADYIKEHGTVLKGQTTVQYPTKKKLFAIAIYNEETTAVSDGVLVSGSKMFKVTRTAAAADDVTGVEVTLEYDSSTPNLKVPYNQSFKKPGYSVKKWNGNDGREYTPGEPLELEQDLILTAVWEENHKSVTDFTGAAGEQRTATFEFLPMNGAPRYELDRADSHGVLVGQVRFSNAEGDFIDVVADITLRENTVNPVDNASYSGKFWNTYVNSYDWFSGDGNTRLDYCQIKTGTVFTFPAVYGMEVNFKAIDLEQDNLLNVHRSYVSTSTLTDGTLLNPGYEKNHITGEYTLVANNYDAGGMFEYSGKTMTAELLVRESSIIHSRATEDADKATVLTGDYGWNHGSCFMDNLSVTYPILYSVRPTLSPEISTVTGEQTANFTYLPEAPKNTNGKFTAGTDITMVVTPTYAQKYDNSSEVPTGVTVATEGDGVPEDGAVYTFQMPDADMKFTVKMIGIETRSINSSPMPRDAGRIAYTPDYISFVDGKSVTLTANPKVGYQFVKWTTDDEGKTPVAGAGYTMVDRDLTFTVGMGTGTPTYYAQFTKGNEGTVYYLINHAILLNEDGEEEKPDHDLTNDLNAQTEGFPGSIKESAMIIPTYYTMYKEGYTLDHWQACTAEGTTINTGGENGVYSIGSYYYFENAGDVAYIKPVFRKNKTNFDYRTTEVDITWDFRTAYFAQSMDYDTNRSEIHYSTHSTINRPADATGQVTMDVPLIISTGEFGKMNNQTLDEWCTIGEGTKIQIPSGLDATFTIATFAPITSTKIDDDVLKTYTKRTENDVDVYVYTYRTQSPKTYVTLTIGDDFSYYKYIRAQLPSAEKVAVNTAVNVPYMGSVELVSTGTKPDGDDLDIFDVTEGEPTDGSKNYRAPLGSYVTVVAKRNRLYEFDKWVDGDGNEIVGDGENIIITTDRDIETGAVTSKLIYRLLEYVSNFKAIFRDRPQYQINYTAGPVATGIAPPVTIIEKGESFTLPKHNQVLYYEGHTLKYWLDEAGNKYDFGQVYTPGKTFNPDASLPSGTAAFIVPDGNLVLSPVFQPNEFSFGDILDEVTVTWPLAKAEGATSINFHKSSGVVVDQLEYDGMKIDVPLEIYSFGDTNTAFNGTDDDFCSISSGMVIGVPATPGCKIRLNSYADNVTTTEIGRYRGWKMTLEQKETKGDADGCWDGSEIKGSTSTSAGALTTGAYTAGLSPEVTCTNEKGYGVLDILFNGDASTFTSVQAVYSAISIPMPELNEVSVGGVKLGDGIYGKYSVVDLNSDKELNNIRVNAVGEKLPEVKVTTIDNIGVAKIVQPTVADPRATIILKTDSGIVAGVYVLNFKVGRVTGTPNLTGVNFYRQEITPAAGVYECGTVAPNSVMELTFDRVMAEKTLVTARDIEFADGLRGRLDDEIIASEGQTLKFTFWNLDMGKEYKFRIKANTLEDVYGNPYTEDIWLHFTVSNRTMQNMRRAPYNFVVTHKETFDHSLGGNIEDQRSDRTQVASDELIANLEAAGIPYGTIDEAVAAANADKGTTGFYIFVPDGEYQIGGNYAFPYRSELKDNKTNTLMTEQMCYNKTYNNGMTKLTRSRVSIIGQSQDKTVIFNDPFFYGLRYSATMQVDAKTSDCYFQDLTFDNRYSWHQMQEGKQPGGQCAAFYDVGLRTIMKNVGVFGFQDSYRSDASNSTGFMGRAYYETCTFAGTVDYICGDGDMWWEQCRFLMRHRGNNNLCAPRQLDYQKWGYIYNNCTIDAEDEAKSHAYMNGGWGHTYEQTIAINKNFTIGRPWDGSPAATYLYTKMILQPSDVGWASMKDEGLTLRFQEYGSVAANGEAIDLSVRTTCISTPGPGSYDAVMSPSEVKLYTIHNVLGGDEGYDPTVYTEQRPAVTPGFDDTELSWHDDADALLYAIFKSDTEDGEYKLFAITTSTVYDCGEDAGWYKVRAANQRGGLGEWSKAVQYVPVDRYLLVLNQTKSGASECRDDENNAVGWSTICLPFNAKVPERDINANPVAENFKVYAAVKIQDNTITLKRVHYITSNVGYVVYGYPGQYLFKGSSHNALEYDGYESLLNGNPSDQNITAAGTNCYTLSYKPAVAGIGFYKYVGSYLNSKKAYLTVDVFTTENEKNATTSPSNALQNANIKGIRFVFEDFDEPTGIYDADAADDADSTDDVIYDLMGRRLRRQDMRSGNIYIINGQTVRK